MKLLTAPEMVAADTATISGLGVPGSRLMEQAGEEVACFLLKHHLKALERGVLVLAGSGNNGGDGFVVARLLFEAGFSVRVLALKEASEMSGDARQNAERWKALSGDTLLLSEKNWSSPEVTDIVGSAGVLLDALFGTGFSGPLQGFLSECIPLLNTIAAQENVLVCAVDVPSGLDATSGALPEVVLQADETITFQFPKIAHVLFPASSVCGRVWVADIGIPEELPEVASVRRSILTPSVVRDMASPEYVPSAGRHKGGRGHVLVIGGAPGHIGAGKLAAEAALLFGAGLSTLAVPEEAACRLEVVVHELMVAALGETNGCLGPLKRESVEQLFEGKSALVIGPGMGTSGYALDALGVLLEAASECDLPTVLDADALNLLSLEQALESVLPRWTVLTPHPGEMGRLMGRSPTEVQSARLETALGCSRRFGATVVLKGARTVVTSADGDLWVNRAATEVLGTGGSGDVLAGMLGAALARGLSPQKAACVSVYAHGAAGERLFHEMGGSLGVLASDIAGVAPLVMNELMVTSVGQDAPEPGSLFCLLENEVEMR